MAARRVSAWRVPNWPGLQILLFPPQCLAACRKPFAWCLSGCCAGAAPPRAEPCRCTALTVIHSCAMVLPAQLAYLSSLL